MGTRGEERAKRRGQEEETHKGLVLDRLSLVRREQPVCHDFRAVRLLAGAGEGTE